MTTPSDSSGLATNGVSCAYDGVEVLHDVTLELTRRGMLGLAGPNGSGKSTLLRLMAGGKQPSKGFVSLDGKPILDVSPRERARRIAVVPQHVNPSLTFRVEALVAMGRTPHTGFLNVRTGDDRRAVEDALSLTDTLDLRTRSFNTLSGGEQQRVMLAVALAQRTDYVLLDEPTVHLDLHHQHLLLEMLSSLNATRGVGILAVMHDLNLATLYFGRLAILDAGRLVAAGPSEEIMARQDVLAVFRAPLTVIPHPQTGAPQVLLRRKS